jgi:hypothetical protein
MPCSLAGGKQYNVTLVQFSSRTDSSHFTYQLLSYVQIVNPFCCGTRSESGPLSHGVHFAEHKRY